MTTGELRFEWYLSGPSTSHNTQEKKSFLVLELKSIKIKVRTLDSKLEIEIETEYFHHINEDIKQMYLRHVHTYCQNYRYVD